MKISKSFWVVLLFLMALGVLNKTQAQTWELFTYTNVLTSLNTSVPSGNYYINTNIDVDNNVTIQDAEILIAGG